MRIVADKDRLTVTHVPWILGGLIWAWGLILLGAVLSGYGDQSVPQRLLVAAIALGLIAIANAVGAPITIVFDRASGQVTRRVGRLVGATVSQMSLDQVEGARVEARWFRNSRGERVVIDTRQGPLLPELGYSPRKKAPNVDTINDWLTTPVVP
ncbi:MAG: hypothetical protein AAF667_14540 [Pseudomonadota bacterium]